VLSHDSLLGLRLGDTMVRLQQQGVKQSGSSISSN